MPRAKVVWGIDVGQCALRGLKMRLTDGGADVLAFDVIEYPQILSQPEADPDQLLAEAIEKFVSRNDVRGCDVVLGVPGQQTFTRFSKLPPVEPKKINSIVGYEAQQQIPFDIDEVIWDYQVFSAPDTPEVEVGIFAIRRDLVQRHLSAFVERGIEPVIVQASPLALFNYLAFDDLPEDGAVVILDVGAQNTDLVVARPDGAWTRNIPLGGNNFTEALVKAFKLSFSKAENLKRTAATSRYARQIFQAMRPVFADLVAEIQRSLGYYTSTHRDVQLKRVIGMGSAFKLPGLQKYLQQNLQMEVDRLSGFKKLQPGPGVNAAVFSEHVMSLGVAYGLAIQGLGAGTINANLLPVEVVRSVAWRHKQPWFAAAAAVIALAAGAMWYSQARLASALAASRGDVDRVMVSSRAEALAAIQQGPEGLPPRAAAKKILLAAQYLRNELQRVKSQGTGGEEQVKQIMSLYQDRVLWPELIKQIHETLPKPPDLWPDLVAAKSPEEYAAALRKVERRKRKLIFIDAIDAFYSTDVYNSFETGVRQTRGREMDRGRDYRERGPMQTSQAPQEQAAGFVLTIRGRTPYGASVGEAVRFLADEWLSRLKQIRGTSKAYFVGKIDEAPKVRTLDKAVAGSGVTVSLWGPPDSPLSVRKMQRGSFSALRPTGMTMSPAARGGRFDRGGDERDRGMDAEELRARGPSAGRSMTAGMRRTAIETIMQDPLTGERTEKDYAFTVKLAIVLGEPKDQSGGAAQPAAGALR